MKEQIYFTFFSIKSCATYKIEFNPNKSNNSLIYFIQDFIQTFNGQVCLTPEGNRLEINCSQKNTLELQAKVLELVNRNKSNQPVINKINDFIKKLSINEIFFILPVDSASISLKNQFMMANELMSLNNPSLDYNDLENSFNNLFGHIIEKYKSFSPSIEKKTKIGKGLKTDRICRFCHKDSYQTSFKKIAHSIPEALGNKNIILNEECDIYNEKFSKTLEKDILVYLRLFNTFYQVKNKNNKVPKIKQNNFEMLHINPNLEKNKEIIEKAKEISEHPFNPNNFFVIVSRQNKDSSAVSDTIHFKPPTISLDSDEKIILQNIYKALVKFALSCIKTEDLEGFKETLNWIADENLFKENLPKVAVLLNPEKLELHPSITIHIRNDDDTTLPYAVGEFHYTTFVYVFIIPIFNGKEINFNKFKEFFSYYQFDKLPWVFNDFNDSTPRKLSLKMNFEENKK